MSRGLMRAGRPFGSLRNFETLTIIYCPLGPVASYVNSATARPFLSSPVGMNREVIRHGETGFLAAGPREWLEGLDALLSDAELRRRVGEAGRAEIEARYSLRVVSLRLVELLLALVEERQR